jgi:hypothetical protein
LNITKLTQSLETVKMSTQAFDPALFTLAISASLGAALFASFLYKYFYEHRSTGSQVHRAFPLLGISITTLFIAVQVSLPLSLGLLGALSIIRFRTPIKEPEEVGFIMLVIASSIICATLEFEFLMILNILALLTLILIRSYRFWGFSNRDGYLFITLKDADAVSHLNDLTVLLKKQVHAFTLETSSSQNGISNLQFSFTGLKGDIPQIQAQIKKIVKAECVNFYFNKSIRSH